MNATTTYTNGFLKLFFFVSAKTEQNIFAHTSVLCFLVSFLHTPHTAFLIRFHPTSTSKRRWQWQYMTIFCQYFQKRNLGFHPFILLKLSVFKRIHFWNCFRKSSLSVSLSSVLTSIKGEKGSDLCVMSQISHNICVALQSDLWMRSDISIYRRRWQPLSVHLWSHPAH